MGAYADHRKRLVRELKDRIVKAGGKGVSVHGGRGTAWGWIEVSGPSGMDFTPKQRRAVEQVTGSREVGPNSWCGEMEDVARMLGIPSPF